MKTDFDTSSDSDFEHPSNPLPKLPQISISSDECSECETDVSDSDVTCYHDICLYMCC